MAYTIDRLTSGAGFEDTDTRTRGALKAKGFGVLTEIDVTATMKAKLDHDMPPYRILGACNPSLALGAINAELKVDAMLPCNEILYQVDGGIEVSTIDNPELKDVAAKVRGMLAGAQSDI